MYLDLNFEPADQGFLQVLRIWGSSSKFDGVEACNNTWGEHGRLKTVVKNTCEEVNLLVKLPAIILQACKLPKNELLHTNFSMI